MIDESRVELMLCRHAHHLSADPTWWSRVWPLLITAGLTLAVLGFVQFVIVPRVETRKRRENRWEEDVLALGELLTFEYQKTLSELHWQLLNEAMLDELGRRDEVDHAKLDELKRAGLEKQNAALDAHRALDARVDWLAGRIISIDRTSPRIRGLRVRRVRLSVGQLEDLVKRYRNPEDPVPTEQTISDAASSDREILKELIGDVESLAAGPPLRAATWRRRRSRSMLAKRRIVRKPRMSAQAKPADKS